MFSTQTRQVREHTTGLLEMDHLIQHYLFRPMYLMIRGFTIALLLSPMQQVALIALALRSTYRFLKEI